MQNFTVFNWPHETNLNQYVHVSREPAPSEPEPSHDLLMTSYPLWVESPWNWKAIYAVKMAQVFFHLVKSMKWFREIEKKHLTVHEQNNFQK